jgi:predicted GH43/DUF377 family glycosyl hydrolase
MMTQRWKKSGLLFDPQDKIPGITHAAVPVALALNSSTQRIFFSGRDSQNRSLPFFFDLNMEDLSVSNIQQDPVLPLGNLGTFDDSGVMPSCVVQVHGKYYLYYIGWNLGVTVPFRNSIGRAVSTDGLNFKKEFEGPVLDRNETEPHFSASCSVRYESGIWKAWYLNCVKWELENNKPKHSYHIKYAESNDGIHWERNGIIAIDFKNKFEYAISVPRVFKKENGYVMWYSYRGSADSENYKIGFAESRDGINWTRKDEWVNLPSGPLNWDREMQCYPCIVNYKHKLYMLYNGNGYGKTGIGIAELENQNMELS